MSPFHSGAWKDGRSLEVEAEGRYSHHSQPQASEYYNEDLCGPGYGDCETSILASLSGIPGETQVVETAGEN
ncbi:hypothetical protein PABG_07069 [Paracoccidioides brasiliensis Pb03]|nr:hypothetical protein PABG_07069 [Paracoccidioides brasiliensis Pb03]